MVEHRPSLWEHQYNLPIRSPERRCWVCSGTGKMSVERIEDLRKTYGEYLFRKELGF